MNQLNKTKAARLNEALRLNALDDLEAHLLAENNYTVEDRKAIRRLTKLIDGDKPSEANQFYSGLDTFLRENIPESLDDWLRAAYQGLNS